MQLEFGDYFGRPLWWTFGRPKLDDSDHVQMNPFNGDMGCSPKGRNRQASYVHVWVDVSLGEECSW